MNIEEYNVVKNYTYLEYCDYLQKKYGIPSYDYMTKSFNKNPKITRTNDGLFAHHKFEDHAIMLGNKEYAKNNPYDWQKKENMIYCDYLEHLFLHILICEYPHPERNIGEAVGIGGVQNFIVPELNDLYSGFHISQEYKQICFNKVKDAIDLYIILVNRFIKNSYNYPLYSNYQLRSSFNERFGTWDREKNRELTNNFIIVDSSGKTVYSGKNV